MLSSILILALAATGLAQVPEGYRKVYLTSMVNAKFVVTPKAATAGSTMLVQTLASKVEQQWHLTDGATKLVWAADPTFCADAGPKTGWRDMADIYLQPCAADAVGQNWNVMEDGRIALEGSTPQECIDLKYMRATENNPVGLFSCAGLGNTGAADKGINWPLVEVEE